MKTTLLAFLLLCSASLYAGELEIANSRIAVESDTKKTLEVSFRRSPGSQITVPDLQIRVYLYEKQPDGKIKLTEKKVMSQWATPPIDWANGEDERLEIASPAFSDSSFYGYTVGIYYRGSLQDARYEPADLKSTSPFSLSIP